MKVYYRILRNIPIAAGAVFRLLFCCLLSQPRIIAQEARLTFEHYDERRGLSAPAVSSMLQDKFGYLWFGTWNGVDRFDGYTFTPYTREAGRATTNATYYTHTLLEDTTSGAIWVGTSSGLKRIDERTGSITHFTPNPQAQGWQISNNIISICDDLDGSMWIATSDGLYHFDKVSAKFTVFRYDSTDRSTISYSDVEKVHVDKQGVLWIGTGRGLDTLDRKARRFVHLWNDPQPVVHDWMRSPYVVNTIYDENDGLLWLGTNGGLVVFDKMKGVVKTYASDPNNPHTLSGNAVSSICRDASGVLWIGTYDHGLSSFDRRTGTITRYYHNEADPGSISSNAVLSVFSERSGTVWALTAGGGVNKLNRVRNYFRAYAVNERQDDIITSPEVKRIIESRSGTVWISSTKGVDTLDKKNDRLVSIYKGRDILLAIDSADHLWMAGEFKGIYRRSADGTTTQFFSPSGQLFDQPVFSMCIAQDRTIWFGGGDGVKSGLYKLDPATKIIRRVSMGNSGASLIHEDKYGLIWALANNGGVLRYDPPTQTLKHYLAVPEDTTTLSDNSVMTIYEEKDGTLWFNFDRYDRVHDNFERVDPSGELSGIAFKLFQDDRRIIWASTSQGISKIDPAAKTVKKYDGSYGFANIKCWENVGCRTRNGEIYFGGSNGFVRFHPDSIRDNTFIPPIVITGFRKFDKPFPVEREIRLAYNDNFLAFEFAALSFTNVEKNRYAYKLEGLDKEWIYSGTRRYASYPNLDPGDYVFRVKGSNNDGVWNEAGTFMTIHIAPPWWETWWAYLAYAALMVGTLYSLRRYELNRSALKNEVRMKEAVLKEKEETERIKSRFFANISHEFRTPLTLIIGPAEKILSNTSEDISRDANIIKRNARRLLELINQLLDLSKLEAGKLQLQASKGNIVSFVKGVALSFESLSESKNITLKLQSEREFIELYFDREKMLQILTNIISNAFKFTAEEGSVTIAVSHALLSNRTESVEIRIRDTGIGIPREELPKLFDRFYQVDSSFTKEHEGTGIGLALTKELVDLHHGHIRVDSTHEDTASGQHGWTEVTIDLPIGRDHLKDEEIVTPQERSAGIEVSTIDDTRLLPTHAEEHHSEPEGTKTIILIVEDNYDMRQYIRESLDEDYAVEEAINGEQGVRKAEKIIPDLIITDMMMPKMDGNELVRIVKGNDATSHIPVILLTARSGQEDKIEGLETGADDYLTKPFNIKELKVRIKNLLAIRKRLQEKFSRHETIAERQERTQEAPRAKILGALDEKFMARVATVIDKHLSEEEFSIEDYGAEVGMSRVQIYRKLKAITGKSTSLYIRSVKLEKAKKMIVDKAGTISEIAYALGFGSPGYFTRCFKEEYGVTPSDLIK